MRSPRRHLLSVIVMLGALGAAAPAAQAVAPCARTSTPSPLVSGRTWVESLAFDPAGRLLFTDSKPGLLLVLDKPSGTARVLARGLPDAGGLAFDGKGHVFVGVGNNLADGLNPSAGGAGIVRVDLKTGRKTRIASGLAMANGVVRTSKGVFYASDDLKPVLDRVRANGKVDAGWLTFGESNGLALSANERYLYANRSLDPTKLVRIDLRDPTRIVTVAAATGADTASFLDGLTLASGDRPYAAAFAAGQVWRADGSGGFCAVGSGMPSVTSVAFGRKGRGFDPKSLYAGSAKGRIVRLPKVL